MFQNLLSRRRTSIQDYAHVRSTQDAAALIENCQLIPMLLRPEEIGGQDHAENRVLVTRDAAEKKREIDRLLLLPMIERGELSIYQAKAEFHRRSIVPVAIHLTGSDPRYLEFKIGIWGKGLIV